MNHQIKDSYIPAAGPAMGATLTVPVTRHTRQSPRVSPHSLRDRKKVAKSDSLVSDRSSIYSNVSDCSTSSSYQTASDHSPTIAGRLLKKDQEELLQAVNEILEKRLAGLEGKIESSQCRLEARVKKVEKQLLDVHSKNTSFSITTKSRNGVDGVKPVVELSISRKEV